VLGATGRGLLGGADEDGLGSRKLRESPIQGIEISARPGWTGHPSGDIAAPRFLPLPGLFVSAVLAGMTMTSLSGLLSLRHAVGCVLAILAIGYQLFAANLSHSIVGAAVIFAGRQSIGVRAGVRAMDGRSRTEGVIRSTT